MTILDTTDDKRLPGQRVGAVGSGPQTRIREFRKLRGLTLLQLAEKIGTTPQTVQRIETGNMTVSTLWLEKVAAALQVQPMDLLGSKSAREIQLVGRIGDGGRCAMSETPSVVHMEVAADQPIAARLDMALGHFEADTLLIANRFRDADIENAHGLDCIVAVTSGPVLLRRVARGRMTGLWTLVPHGNGGEIQYDRTLTWAARIIMAIRYF